MIPLQDTVQARNAPLATWGIILINSVVFIYELALPPDRLEALIATLGMIPARMGADSSSFSTLFTCMFLHGGWVHIIGNMWTLYIFGDNVEDRMGSLRYILFYLLCGLAAGITHLLTNPGSTVPTIGASGAIAGVLGAYLLLFPSARVITLIPIFIFPFIFEIPALVYLGIWFITQLLSGALSLVSTHYYEGIAWWAHVGGFVAGMVLLPAFKMSQQRYRRFYADEYWPW
jgi:membrane associated rhomboid family serine protease